MWMLEILELDYEVDIFVRHAETWRGPPELFQVHPLGKAPVLEIQFLDGRPNLQLAESGLIIQYLCKHYDPKKILSGKNDNESLQIDYYIHYSEGTLQNLLMSMIINTSAKRIAPLGLKTLAKLVTKGINYGYYLHEFTLNMEFLERRLAQNGSGYFVGKTLSAADVMLSFPVYENIFDNETGVRECTNETQLFKKYPQLSAWSDKIRKDPIYLKLSKLMEERVDDLRRQS